MSKRTVFTTVTPLPAGITRATVMETLHDHIEMINLNPLVEDRRPIKAPAEATPEEFHCTWYQLTDKIAYLPGGHLSSKVSYNACFHDLPNGLQTHCYAPMGVNIRGKWTLGGSLPGESIAPVELGLGTPLKGLWLREDVDIRCNIMMTGFVKKTLKKAHTHLVDRMLVRAGIAGAPQTNLQLSQQAIGQKTSSKYNSGVQNHSAPPGSSGFDSYAVSPQSAYSYTASSQDPYNGSISNNRVSWHDLKRSSVPPIENAHPYYQQGVQNGASAETHYAAELPSQHPYYQQEHFNDASSGRQFVAELHSEEKRSGRNAIPPSLRCGPAELE